MGAPGHDKAVAAVMKWTQRDEWRDRFDDVVADHIDSVCEAFDIAPDELPEVLGPDAFAQLIGCAFEDFLTCDFEPDADNVVEDYLKRRGWKEPMPVKRYLHALRGSVMSLYEVVESAPGSHFLVKDLVRGGAPVRVDDKIASRDVARWDRLAARLLPIGGRTYMAGGVLRFTFEDADAIRQAIAGVRKKLDRNVRRRAKRVGVPPEEVLRLPIEDAVLGEVTPLFTQRWLLSQLQQAVAPSLPKMVNFDGEDLVLAETRFPIPDPVQAGAIENRLDALPALVRDADDPPTWTWLSTGPHSGQKPVTAPSSVMLKTYDESGGRVLGTARLEPGAVMLQTNSTERAERGRALLAETLGALVGPPLTVMQTVEQALAQGPVDPVPREADEDLSLPPDELEAITREMLDRHYREMLSTPIPMLGDRTPRQAARSKAGREKVAAWLKYLENQTAHHAEASDLPPYDFTWMWEALKITDLRR